MPKMKTDRGAAKRVKVTGTGPAAAPQAEPLPHSGEEVERPKRRLARETDFSQGRRGQVRRMLGL